MAQGLRRHTNNSGGPGLIPGRGTRSHMLQLRPSTAKKINKIFLQSKQERILSKKRSSELSNVTVNSSEWARQQTRSAPCLGGAGKPPHGPCPSHLFCSLVPEWDLPAQASTTTHQFPLNLSLDKSFLSNMVSFPNPRVHKSSSSLVLPLWENRVLIAFAPFCAIHCALL